MPTDEYDAWLEGIGVSWFKSSGGDEAESPRWTPPAPGPGPEPAPRDNRMRPDCKPIRGKVSGPVNHLLCATHGHIVDVKAGTIIAKSLEEYKKRWPRKGPAQSGAGYSGGKASQGGGYGGTKDYPIEQAECDPSPDYSGEVGIGEASGSFESGDYSDPETGASMTGVKMSGKAAAVEVNADTPVGNLSASFLKAQGSAQAGYEYDPATGAEFAGAKASGSASVLEGTIDGPYGTASGSFLKAQGSAQVGYEYDPESQVEFAGAKLSGSASVLDGKVSGKYGNASAQLLGASVSSKTGVEVDKKTGKIFIGTANSAEAKVAEASGTLQTADGSVQLTGGVQVLKASASLDANVVADKYGIDVSAKVGAEANLVKAEAGGEIRLTPKALFDNTVGWMTGTTAPDYLDFGPVLGAKVSAGEGVGGTVEGGYRLGVDEVNVRGGGFLELAEGVGLDLKVGMRLGPLKYLYDQQNAAPPPGPAPCTPEDAGSPVAASAPDAGSDAAPAAEAPAQGIAEAASNTWDQLLS